MVFILLPRELGPKESMLAIEDHVLSALAPCDTELHVSGQGGRTWGKTDRLQVQLWSRIRQINETNLLESFSSPPHPHD